MNSVPLSTWMLRGAPRSPSEWAEVFGDALLASAALDRLTHHARVTVITGGSYRQRHRKKEVKLAAKPTSKQ